jgi:hypothetical protein
VSRLVFLLGLLAAVAGTPLRQAEAADDLARALAELGDGDRIEMVDGGVGDDSGDTIKADPSHAPLLLMIADAPPAAPPGNALPCPGPILLSRAGRNHPPPASPPQRLALLQCFLF